MEKMSFKKALEVSKSALYRTENKLSPDHEVVVSQKILLSFAEFHYLISSDEDYIQYDAYTSQGQWDRQKRRKSIPPYTRKPEGKFNIPITITIERRDNG